PDFAEHLLDHDLNVLVVDLNALVPVYALHFLQDVVLNAADALDAEHFLRIDRTIRQLIACFDLLTDRDTNTRAIRNRIDLRLRFASHFDLAAVLRVTNFLDDAVELGDRRLALRIPGFEELLDTRKTLRDIVA